VIRPGAIGDCILSLPAIECLRAQYLEVWVATPNMPLIRFAAAVGSIAASGLDSLGLPDREPPRALIERLRGFDSIVSWYGANRAEFRDAVRRLGLPFHFLPALPPPDSSLHAADFFAGQVRGFCDCPVPAVPRLDCPRADEGFAVIHPFSGSAKKNWPLERFRELAARLEQRMPVRWCAGPNEDWRVARGPWQVDAVRIENLYELACWLARSHVYIGNDSGITHLAAAAGAPVVALFGPTDPARWAPRGDRVRIVATDKLSQPVEQIPAEAVLKAVESLENTVRR